MVALPRTTGLILSFQIVAWIVVSWVDLFVFKNVFISLGVLNLLDVSKDTCFFILNFIFNSFDILGFFDILLILNNLDISIN